MDFFLITVPVEGDTITKDTVLNNRSRFFTLHVKNEARVDMFNGYIKYLIYFSLPFHLEPINPHVIGWLEFAGKVMPVLDPNEPMLLMVGEMLMEISGRH